MNQLMALPTWDDRSPGWVDDQLVADHRRGAPDRHPARRVRRRPRAGATRRWPGRQRLSPAPGRPDAAPLRDPPRHRPRRALGRARARGRRPAPAARAVTGGRRRAGAGHLPRLLLPGRAGLLGGPAGRGPAAAQPRLVARRRLDPAPVVAGQPRAGPHRRRRPRGRAGLRGLPRSRWRTGSATGWPSPRSATTAPARCATWAATTRRTTSSPACCPRSSPTTSPTRCSPAARTSPASSSTWVATGTARCWWAPRWPSATAPAFRAWPFQEAALAPSVEAGRQRLGDEWEPLLARGAELGVLAAVATALRTDEPT